MNWGLWDARDKCWMGNKDGPLTYEGKLMAQYAATIATEQFGRWIMPKEYDGTGTTKKDEVKARYTGAEAITRLEARA